MLSIISIYKITFNKYDVDKNQENTCICIHRATHFRQTEKNACIYTQISYPVISTLRSRKVQSCPSMGASAREAVKMNYISIRLRRGRLHLTGALCF